VYRTYWVLNYFVFMQICFNISVIGYHCGKVGGCKEWECTRRNQKIRFPILLPPNNFT
jgi:hypothetical protein